MNLKQTLLLAGLMSLSMTAGAQVPSNYFGMSIDGVDLESGSGAEEDLSGFNLRYGREFGNFFALELRVAAASDSSSDLFSDPGIRYGAGLAKLTLPFEKVNLYVMGGTSEIRVDGGTVSDLLGTTIAGSNSVTISSVEVKGGGIELLSSPTSGLNIEYLAFGESEDMTVLSIGFTHRFDFPGLR